MTYLNKEYRVWCETGDLVGLATVTRNYGWFTVTKDPFYKHESLAMKKPRSWRSQEAAERYARMTVKRYMKEAIDWETQGRGEPPVGVLTPHGYSIQEVETEGP